jgi:hypothetical protein
MSLFTTAWQEATDNTTIILADMPLITDSTQRPTISALFPAGPNEHGIFAVTAAEYGPQQLNITIENLVFKRHPLGGPAAFLRSGNPNRDGIGTFVNMLLTRR